MIYPSIHRKDFHLLNNSITEDGILFPTSIPLKLEINYACTSSSMYVVKPSSSVTFKCQHHTGMQQNYGKKMWHLKLVWSHKPTFEHIGTLP